MRLFFRAFSKPLIARSPNISRSNWDKAPIMANIREPDGVVVSIGCRTPRSKDSASALHAPLLTDAESASRAMARGKRSAECKQRNRGGNNRRARRQIPR